MSKLVQNLSSEWHNIAALQQFSYRNMAHMATKKRAEELLLKRVVLTTFVSTLRGI